MTKDRLGNIINSNIKRLIILLHTQSVKRGCNAVPESVSVIPTIRWRKQLRNCRKGGGSSGADQTDLHTARSTQHTDSMQHTRAHTCTQVGISFVRLLPHSFLHCFRRPIFCVTQSGGRFPIFGEPHRVVVAVVWGLSVLYGCFLAALCGFRAAFATLSPAQHIGRQPPRIPQVTSAPTSAIGRSTPGMKAQPAVRAK
jgi:hypothetical protein